MKADCEFQRMSTDRKARTPTLPWSNRARRLISFACAIRHKAEYLIPHFLRFYVLGPFLCHIVSRIFSRPVRSLARSLVRMRSMRFLHVTGYDVSLMRFDNA